MMPLISAFGVNALSWAAGAIALLIGGALTVKAIKTSGAAGQRAADTQKGLDDVTAASKARATVDARSDAGVDQRLHDFERK